MIQKMQSQSRYNQQCNERMSVTAGIVKECVMMHPEWKNISLHKTISEGKHTLYNRKNNFSMQFVGMSTKFSSK